VRLGLLRKVEELESRVRPVDDSEPRDQVVSAALARLDTNDLLMLIDAFEGPDPGKGLSADQVLAAGERLQRALETECLQAGFKSLAEFDRLYPANTAPTKLRNIGPAWKDRHKRN